MANHRRALFSPRPKFRPTLDKRMLFGLALISCLLSIRCASSLLANHRYDRLEPNIEQRIARLRQQVGQNRLQQQLNTRVRLEEPVTSEDDFSPEAGILLQPQVQSSLDVVPERWASKQQQQQQQQQRSGALDEGRSERERVYLSRLFAELAAEPTSSQVQLSEPTRYVLDDEEQSADLATVGDQSRASYYQLYNNQLSDIMKQLARQQEVQKLVAAPYATNFLNPTDTSYRLLPTFVDQSASEGQAGESPRELAERLVITPEDGQKRDLSSSSLAQSTGPSSSKVDSKLATQSAELTNKQKTERAQVTTLLEDESSSNSPDKKKNQQQQQEDKPKIAMPTIIDKASGRTLDLANFGKVLTNSASGETTTERPGSAFHDLYSKASKYIPFLQQLANLVNPPVDAKKVKSDSVEAENAKSTGNSNNNNNKDNKQKGDAHNVVSSNHKDRTESHHESKLKLVPGMKMELKQNDTTSGSLSTESPPSDSIAPVTDGSPVKQTVVTTDQTSQTDENPFKEKATKREPVASSSRSSQKRPLVRLTNTNDELPQVASEQEEDIIQSQPTVNLLRHSSLVLPMQTPADDMHPAGRYVYAPTHHFHLNTGPTPKGHRLEIDTEDEEEQPYAHRGYARRLHPDEERLYGPREAAYLRADNSLGLGIGKSSNDAYFLVIVGAFCVMAMAVVLAAGLFAYRVQQGRKSNSESEYPTYGVVGPNNMSAKCGAAALASGYFVGGSAGPGAMALPGATKLGAPAMVGAKHFGDLYSTASDSGITTGANSKTSSVGKRSSSNDINVSQGFMGNQNAARMYHYQTQKQQMIASDRTSAGRHTSASDLDSDDDNEEGSYTVYECPGLASAHEMEIKNPLFNDDHSP